MYLEDQAKALSGNAFRKMCRREYLNYLRIREWQDLHAQLRQLCRGLGMESEPAGAPAKRAPDAPRAPDGRAVGIKPAGSTPAQGGRGSLAVEVDSEKVHTALLAGLLSHIGLRSEASREYQGTRGITFMIWPGSALARSRPQLVVAAELVETSRLWGRICARIDPAWVERVGGDLLRRSYSEPRWNAKRASVEATEKVMLLGVTLVAARTVQFDRIDPEHSRELFIRHALVERDWTTRHKFFSQNQQALDDVAAWEERTRRRDIVVDDETLFALYDARIPAEVTSGRHFDSWWKKASRATPDLMTFTTEMLIAAGSERFDAAAFPDRFTSGGVDLELGYVFDPGRRDDGVTVTIPLAVLARVDPAAFERQIPGLRADLAVALIRSLPKTLRRNFVPVPDFAKAALARIDQLGDRRRRQRLAARRARRRPHRTHRNRHQVNRFRSAEGSRPSADEFLGGRRAGPRGGRRQGSDHPAGEPARRHPAGRGQGLGHRGANRIDGVPRRRHSAHRDQFGRRPSGDRLPRAGRRGRDGRPAGLHLSASINGGRCGRGPGGC